jgi:hypothetical protein
VIGPGPVLQYQPAQTDSARRVFGQSLGRDRARHRVAVPPRDRCHLPSRPRRAAHAAATPCAMPLAGARTLASRTRQLRGHRHLKALLSADRCRPAATSTPRAAHAAAARAPYPLAIGRRRSCSLLFPQLSSSSRHSARPHHRHFSPTTIDRRLWCFSDPIDPTRSIA